MRKLKLAIIGAASGIAMMSSAADAASCGKVSITEMDWASSQIITEVAKFLMEQGYGCKVEKVPSATTTAVASLAENGEPDIVTELWLNSTGDAYSKMAKAGKVERLADVLAPGGVEGWWVPGADRQNSLTEAHKWLDRVGLNGFADHYPHQLSGGMQQRVGIARALASNSPIMLMDEAFSALDPLIRTDMQDLLLELQTELHKTIVFITHDLDEALKLADHLVILKDGFIVQQGEPQNILLNPNDPYIEDFVSDINRARVLRVRSIMTPIEDGVPTNAHGEVDYNDTLESMIAHSGGDTSHSYIVVKDGAPVGVLDMTNLVKALVPRAASNYRSRSDAILC